VTEPRLGTRTIRSMFWAYGSYVGGRALVLVSTAVLARLLTPSDFGVVALALTFMTFLETIKDIGLTQALIGSPPEERAERTQTVFVWTVLIGAVLAAVAAASAPLAARFFDHDVLVGVIPVLALNFLVQALGATHDSLARIGLDYRTRTIAEMGDVILRGTAGIALALAGAGVWSLVLGYLIGSIVRVAVLWWKVPWRPRLRWSTLHLRDLVAFGGVLMLVDIASAFSHNMDYLFVGRVLGSEQLGLYTIGFRLPELIIINLAIVAGDVLFPAYASLDPARLREGFLVSLRAIALLVFPVCAMLVVLARPLVLVLFGDQWEPSIEVMRILAIYAVLSTLNIPAGVIYKVTRRARILLFFAIPFLVALFAVLWRVTDEGIVAVAWGLSGVAVVQSMTMLVVAAGVLEVPYPQVLRALVAPVLIGVGMGLAMLAPEQLIEPPLPALLVGGVCGALAGAVLMRLLARDVLDRLLRMAFPGRAEPAVP
jgi:PST family polysaccharide transporter